MPEAARGASASAPDSVVAAAPPQAAFTPELPLAALLRLARRWSESTPEQRSAGCTRSVRVAVLANHTSQLLAGALPLALGRRGVCATLYDAGYDQWERELLAPDSGLAQFGADVVLLSLSSCLLAFRNTAPTPAELADSIAERVLAAKARLNAEFVVTLLEPLPEELDTGVWAHSFRAVVNQRLRERLAGCVLVDLEPLIRRTGSDAWYSGQYLLSSKLPWHPDRSARHADYLARFISSLLARPIKLCVVDLDNTLWGGVVGELGAANVELDAQGSGLPYLRLQRFLLGLHAQGVLLAICSKNNPEDALPVFQRREMLLSLEHFAAVEIGWRPKSEALRAILEQLNLSATAVAFLDDHHLERGEIRHALPEVYVPEWPSEPIDLVPQLVESGRFLIVRSGAEDHDRQEFYRIERVRQEARTAAPDLGEYYRQLQLGLRAQRVDAESSARVLDLLAKTNQFNLTTRRHGRAALEAWLARDDAYVRAFRLADALGDYGLVGVLLAAPGAAGELVIDSWLLSCRAMGRTVEDAMFRHLWAFARERGFHKLVGDYIPTQKNAPVAELYPKLGFGVVSELPGGGRRYECPLSGEPRAAAYVALDGD
jgi:FkbH-like protein